MERKRDVNWIRACLKAYAQMCANSKEITMSGRLEDFVRSSAKNCAADESDIQYALNAVRDE